jgi:MFS family permease
MENEMRISDALSTPPAEETSQVIWALLPLMVVVVVVFVVTGVAIPVLPPHVHRGLGLGTFAVGLVTGVQFASSFVSRIWSGRHSDRRGAKRTVRLGLAAASAAGFLYALSLAFTAAPTLSAAILLVGRALLGGGESFIITGALSWGLGLVAARNVGKVIAWIGTALYAAFAVGAPAGMALYASYGFIAIALATALLPLAGLLLIAPLAAAPAVRSAQPAVATVLGAVSLPGAALALSSLGFGSVTTFATLLFVGRGWESAWLAMTLFALSFMAVRIALGNLPDRIGGAKVALVSILIESLGLGVISLAVSGNLALIGIVMTGCGCALVYPGLGVEAMRRVPPQSRGLAMGTYTAFIDVTLGVANPLLGLLAAFAGLGAVYGVSALIVLGAAAAIALLPAATN